MNSLSSTCGGLPFALAIAGGGVNGVYVAFRDAMFAIREYTEWVDLLQQRDERAVFGHPGLHHVVTASLKQCEPLASDVDRQFEALCVLEKQMAMPVSVLA